jgi:hypothetical protein
MWSDPVTLGGGMTIVYGSPGRCGWAWNTPSESHSEYHFSSVAFGL